MLLEPESTSDDMFAHARHDAGTVDVWTGEPSRGGDECWRIREISMTVLVATSDRFGSVLVTLNSIHLTNRKRRVDIHRHERHVDLLSLEGAITIYSTRMSGWMQDTEKFIQDSESNKLPLGLSAKASFVRSRKKIPAVLSFASLTTRPQDYFCFAKSPGFKLNELLHRKRLTEVSLFLWRDHWGLNPGHPA